MPSLDAIFTGISKNPEAKAYMMEDGRQALDRKDYDSAIVTFGTLRADHPNDNEIQMLLASAYAGKAGVTLFDLIKAFTDKEDDDTAFVGLAKYFSNSNMHIQSLIESSEGVLINNQLNANGRYIDVNFYLALIEFAKIGIILSRYSLNDEGTAVKSNFSACHDNSNASEPGIPDDEIDKIMTGVAIANEAFEAVAQSESLDSSVSEMLSSLSFAEINSGTVSLNQFKEPVPCGNAVKVEDYTACKMFRGYLNGTEFLNADNNNECPIELTDVSSEFLDQLSENYNFDGNLNGNLDDLLANWNGTLPI